jgi:saccharopine dehydrogenase-like NADP-dependent oxidoreductase
MKTILLFGAGKSATVLIDYLLENATAENWKVVVIDADLQLAQSKIGNASSATALSFDINNETQRTKCIAEADIVISLLPPALHILVAKDCIVNQKKLLTASYLDDEIRLLHNQIENKNLLFLYDMFLCIFHLLQKQ